MTSTTQAMSTTQVDFPVKPFITSNEPLLKRFVADHPAVDQDDASNGGSIDEGLLRDELRFSGLSPMQARREVSNEAVRQRWIRLVHQRSAALQLFASPSRRMMMTDGALEALQIKSGAAQSRRGVLVGLLVGLVVSGIVAFVTWFLSSRGLSLTNAVWVGGVGLIAAVAIGAYVAWRASRSASQIPVTLVAQSVAALELQSIFRSATLFTYAEMEARFGVSPVSTQEMRAAQEQLDVTTRAAFTTYTRLVEQTADLTSDPESSGAAAHRLELKVAAADLGGSLSDGVAGGSDGASLRESRPTGNALAVVAIAGVATLALGAAIVSVPSFFIASARCDFAQAEVRIAECDNLAGLAAEGAELPGVNLSRKNLASANFTDANLRGANLQDAKFNESVMQNAQLAKANLSRAELTASDLRGADLTGADLKDADLSGTDLTNAKLADADLSGANLEGADLSNVDLRKTKLAGAILTSAIVDGANFQGVTATGMDLSGASLIDTDLTGADLTNAKLAGADITGAKLTGMKLKGATLDGIPLGQLFASKADLTGALLGGANFDGISGTVLDLSDVNLDGANLSGLDLTKIVLKGSSLIGANLTSADLRDANFEGVDLTEANLTLADISGASMAGSRFVGATLNDLRAIKSDLSGSSFTSATLVGADFAGSNLKGASGLAGNAQDALWKGAVCPSGKPANVCRS